MNRLNKCLIGIPALMLFAGMLFAHGDDEHEESAEAAQPLEQTVQERLDSLYSQINVSYQTVKPILQEDCYNCHSDRTDFPWYYKVPGIKSMINDHIKEGREHLDFSNGFPFGGHAGQIGNLKEMRHEIDEGDMPPWSYRMMHWGSTIDGDQRDSLFAWIDSSIVLLRAFNRAEGLPEN